MMNSNKKRICAIYTRKSSEEGLEQDFNSLHAQREACEAYTLSQAGEGWVIKDTLYDDGGYSGGSMERPALKALIKDIEDGKINIVVVYKIDRLTRSLMDFSKLVEVFDKHDVTFVSVTQSFNTTTSMGRLTLNVLLSFAQFEREVTGERIRDKIAASKKKGMWMGGFPPMGYLLENRTLIPHPEDQKLVRFIFEEYLKSDSVRDLHEKLISLNYRTPIRKSKKGKIHGNALFSRGHLYRILNNPVYIGKIQHKDKIYDGQHEGIIEPVIFEDVQKKLKSAHNQKTLKAQKSGSLLKGYIYDQEGTPYSPTYTSKKKKRYYYYINQGLLQHKDHPRNIMARLPAFETEKVVKRTIGKWIYDYMSSLEYPEVCYYLQNHPVQVQDTLLRNILDKVIIGTEDITVILRGQSIEQELQKIVGTRSNITCEPKIEITTPLKNVKTYNGAIVLNLETPNNKDPLSDLPPNILLRLIRGIIWREEHFSGKTMLDISRAEGHGQNYVRKCILESLSFPET